MTPASRLAGDVYQCAECCRLSLLCGQCNDLEVGRTLNRVFAAYCRRCGGSLQHPKRADSYFRQWTLASRFEYDWRYVSTESPVAECVADLHDVPGFRAGTQVLLERSFVDGLLAVHQGGGGMALVRVFSPTSSRSKPNGPLWAEPEEEAVEVPDGDYVPEVFRPYPIVRTWDGRRLLFSTRYAVFCLDLRSLPGWNIDPEHTDYRAIASFSRVPDWRLAAAPIAIPAALSGESQVGLLVRHVRSNAYRWKTLDLEAQQAVDDDAASWTELDLRGAPVQWRAIGRQGIAFSTPLGQWWWDFSAAERCQSAELRRVLDYTTAARQLVLDQHTSELNSFRRPMQYVLPVKEGRQVVGYGAYYRSTGGGSLETCYVRLEGGTADNPRMLLGASTAIPMGRWSEPDTGLTEMLFLAHAGGGGELYRQPPGLLTLDRLPEWTPAPEEIHGLYFVDPLLVLLLEDDAPGMRQLEFRTLRHSANRPVVKGLRLVADPLMWSRWLFTCERQGDEHRVYRRTFEVRSERDS